MKRLAFALAGATLAAGAFAQTQWDLPTGYAVGSFQTENVQQFAADVDKATGGKLKIVLHPNGSLYKANEIKRAVQTGQAQAGEFILSGAANENALFGVDSIPFLADSYPAAKKLSDASRPALDKLLATQGMKLLFVSPWPGQSLYSSKPVETIADLKGTKMRAYNPATSRIAQLAEEKISGLVDNLGGSALFAARFRENAGRALLFPKKNPALRMPLWQLRRRSANLLRVAWVT